MSQIDRYLCFIARFVILNLLKFDRSRSLWNAVFNTWKRALIFPQFAMKLLLTSSEHNFDGAYVVSSSSILFLEANLSIYCSVLLKRFSLVVEASILREGVLVSS